MKKVLGWVAGIFGALVGIFAFLQRSKLKEVEAKLENAEFDTKDQLLKQTQDNQTGAIQAQKDILDNIRKEHDQALAQNQSNLTPEQVEEYWKTRNSSRDDQ